MFYEKKEKKFIPNTEIKETCIGGICEGKCRELYYAICPAHQKFYIDYSSGRPLRVYLPSERP